MDLIFNKLSEIPFKCNFYVKLKFINYNFISSIKNNNIYILNILYENLFQYYYLFIKKIIFLPKI